MLKQLWRTWFSPSRRPAGQHPQPPWVTPRLVAANLPEYEQLRARLDNVAKPLDGGALEVLRDRRTGQGWELVLVADGPSPLYGLRPRNTH